MFHRTGGDNAKAAGLDLTSGQAYDKLLAFGGNDLHRLAFERDYSAVGDCAARNGKLLALLTAKQGHEGVHLNREELYRLVTWMDTYAYRVGHYSDRQERELRELRGKPRPLLRERHHGNRSK